MIIEAFISKQGDKYTFESISGKFYIRKNGNTDSYDTNEQQMWRKFEQLKRSIGR